MCVVATAFEAHPKWRLILTANRDEFHARPSAPLARWEGDDAHIVAGRDLQSGGTWLGVSEAGRVAVITNIRTGILPDPDKASRGDLVSDYLRGRGMPAAAALDAYNAFSLMTFNIGGGPEGATLTANRPEPMAAPLAPGIHGLSNGAPEEAWPRKDRLLAAFADCLNDSEDLTESLFALLADESIDDSIFIRDEVYGTRCSTVVLVDWEGAGTIIERRFGPDGLPTGQSDMPFRFQSSPKFAG
jgi:uncharacterized protein with NRDE domain